MSLKSYNKVNLEQLENIASSLSNNIKIGDVICLNGDLGSGKTQFAKFFIKNLIGKNQEVSSPTFPLVQVYKTDHGDIFHFDLYRLKDKEELYEIAIEDALSDGISLIEWPDIARDLLPKQLTEVNIEFTDDDNYRNITILDRN